MLEQDLKNSNGTVIYINTVNTHLKRYETMTLVNLDLDGNLHYENGVFLGKLIMDVDGYQKFFPKNPSKGYWSPHMMRAIADIVDEANKAWDEEINEYFKVNGQVTG